MTIRPIDLRDFLPNLSDESEELEQIRSEKNEKKPAYANAADVYSPELIEKLQETYSGLVYVPSSRNYYKSRQKLIFALADKNVPPIEIAELAGLTARRVRQILAGRSKAQPVPGEEE